ncbi:MAG TPA: glycerophosphodiester phosphodiesterase [Chitinophagaceae bacterium]|nr:glycerophosphodiester phosphodiesterase [Chitinophagaceae bacterium]
MKYASILFILLLSMNISSVVEHQSSPLGAERLDVQGHRGCRGLMPENTIPAMLKALDLGVTTLEMDVVVSKDNKIVVSHEPWFDAEISTKPDGSFIKPGEAMQYNIFQMNYDEIAKYDVGMKPHPRFPNQQKIKVIKPLLADLFDSVAENMKIRRRPFPYFNIETKCLPAGDGRFHPKPAEFVELLMTVIKEKQLEERVIIQSFDFRTLKYLHEKYPAIKTSMLIEDSDVNDFEGQLNRLGYTPQIYSPNHTLVDEDLVKQCHDKGMKIIPWTVNDVKQFKKLKKLNIDGVITDYPDLIKD